jgi:hypothetical protein
MEEFAMNKKVIIFLAISLSVVILLGSIFTRKEPREPIIFSGESASLRELSIDDKMREAQIIVIGEVKTRLPSKWKFHNEKDTKNATSQEIFEAEGLFTDSIISVEQILLGDYREPIVRVRSFMGETQQITWQDSSEPSFKMGHDYLLFLTQDTGPTANVDPGDYISVNANTAVYEIVDGRAMSADDEWILEDLIAYIQNSLSTEASSPPLTPTSDEPWTETSLPFADTPMPTDLPTETLLP